MTWALCLNCGNKKFGAICPCSKCGTSSTGNMELDILFSDHHLHEGTLVALGEVIRTLARHTENPELRFFAFISYVAENGPNLLSFNPEPDVAAELAQLYAACGSLPSVEWKLGRNVPLNQAEEPGSPERRRWWQFWRRGP